MPGIEMGSNHDDFVFFPAARDLPDNVQTVQRGLVYSRLDVELQPDRDLVLDQTNNPVVLLRAENYAWDGEGVFHLTSAHVLPENRAAVAPSDLHCDEWLLGNEEFPKVASELLDLLAAARIA